MTIDEQITDMTKQINELDDAIVAISHICEYALKPDSIDEGTMYFIGNTRKYLMLAGMCCAMITIKLPDVVTALPFKRTA